MGVQIEKRHVSTILIRSLGVLLSLAGGGAVLVILCGTAGHWNIPMFWATAASIALVNAAAALCVDLGMAKERFRPGPGGKDRFTLVASKVLLVGALLIAAWDVGEHHWSDTVPLPLQIIALIGFTTGMGLMEWAMVVNRFFSTLIRHQQERGHHVISTGPYGFVRHPGYSAAIVGFPLMGLALGSWLSMVPMLIFSAFLIRRTAIEDRFLHENLAGYREYAAGVQWRLLPGVW